MKLMLRFSSSSAIGTKLAVLEVSPGRTCLHAHPSHIAACVVDSLVFRGSRSYVLAKFVLVLSKSLGAPLPVFDLLKIQIGEY
eukprot:3164580-Amphidinium_carterae.1